jgi:hypothetical protein
MPETVPVPNGPWPSYTLDPPHHPPEMTREEVIEYIKQQYHYPTDMPSDIWWTEFGALQEWGPPYPSLREEGTPWTAHVWKETASGERLENYFFPMARDEKPHPHMVLAFMIDDRERRGIDVRAWRIR